jgi:hypothetical protein
LSVIWSIWEPQPRHCTLSSCIFLPKTCLGAALPIAYLAHDLPLIVCRLCSQRLKAYLCIPLYIYVYIYAYIILYPLCLDVACAYNYVARGLTFTRNVQNSMRDCNLLSCFRACFSNTASMQNIVLTCVSLHFCAYPRRCQNYLLKRILKISSVICSVSSR